MINASVERMKSIFGRSWRDSTLEDILAEVSKLPPVPGRDFNWASLGRHVAWFDRPDAPEQLRRRAIRGEISAANARLLEEWVGNGFIVLEKAIPEADIDGVNEYVEDLFSTEVPNDDVTLLGYTLDRAKGGENVPHREILKLSPDQRRAHARISPWRIHELWARCEAAQRIYKNEYLTQIASLLFGRPAYPRSTINFYHGSQQELHQDMAVFHVFPGNYLIGAWIALEDVSIDSGPLRYAPGSHRSSQFPGFKNHPQDNLRTCPLNQYEDYSKFTNHIADECGGAKPFLGKKGDVFVWHGMMVHGGSPVNNPELTRKSMVIHYLVEGTDQTDRITGPFNWG